MTIESNWFLAEKLGPAKPTIPDSAGNYDIDGVSYDLEEGVVVGSSAKGTEEVKVSLKSRAQRTWARWKANLEKLFERHPPTH